MPLRYLLSFTNQGLVSLFNFALAISLVRQWAVYDFGVFALLLQITVTLEGFLNALVAVPISVWAPAYTRRTPRLAMETTLWNVGSISIVSAAAITAIAAALLLENAGNPWLIGAVVAGFLLARLGRFFCRAFLFSRLMPGMVAIADVAYVGIGSLVIAAVWLWPAEVTLPIVLVVLTAGSLIGVFASLAAAGVRPRLSWRLRTLKRYRELWASVRWSLFGVSTTVAHNRSYTAVVTGFFGPELFAVLAAGEALILGPVRAALLAWGMITRPTMAKAYGRDDHRAIGRINAISVAAVVAGLVVLITFLALAWDWISATIFGEKYGDMSLVVTLWLAVIAVFGVRSVISTTLQAMRAFRPLAMATAYGAVVSLVVVAVLATQVGFQYSILGLAVGETVILAHMLRTYLRLRRSPGSILAADASARG